MTNSKWKTKWEAEEEDNKRYLRQKETAKARRIAKQIAEGFKCTFDNCGMKFETPLDLKAHAEKHNQECWEKMICNQPSCGKQFKKRKEFQDHINEHKNEAIKKAKKDLRSTLMLNQRGILIEEYERDFKGFIGKPLPLKLLGYLSVQEMAENMTDVINTIRLSDGTIMLQAVPDESTMQLANEIQNQRYNNEGFNYATGKVMRGGIGHSDMSKLTNNVETIRRTPDFLKKILKNLVDMEEITEEGLPFDDFKCLYELETGTNIEIGELGYFGLDDFFLNGGLDDIVDLKLESQMWKIVPAGSNVNEETIIGEEIRQESRKKVGRNIASILESKPFGISTNEMMNAYINAFGPPPFVELGCKDLFEICLQYPDICRVDTDIETTLLPAKSKIQQPYPVPVFPLHKLGSFKTRVRDLLKDVGGKEEFNRFVKGYEGWYGNMDVFELKCTRFMEAIKLIPDVCSLRKDMKTLHFFISLSDGSNPDDSAVTKAKALPTEPSQTQTFPVELVTNLHRILESCGSIYHSQLYGKHSEIVGSPLNLGKFGFRSVTSLLRGISGNHGFSFDGSKLTSAAPLTPLKRIDGDELESGWVRVTGKGEADHHVQVVKLPEDRNLWEQELEMEEFYVSKRLGKRLSRERIFSHQAVAAFDTDARIYRARVLSLHEELAKIFFVDEGKMALVKVDSLYRLEKEFCVLPEQVIDVNTTSGVSVTIDSEHEVAWLLKDEDKTELCPKPSSTERKCSSTSITSPQTSMNHALKAIILRKLTSTIAV